jgi:hypothetical protein
VSQTDLVSKLISCLTEDEDKRQDLWVHYLSGNPASSLASYLEVLNKELACFYELQSLLWQVFINSPSDRFTALLSHFSGIEQSILCLLALGLTINELSQYKGISEVRIRHMIQVIKYNECWGVLYGPRKAE